MGNSTIPTTAAADLNITLADLEAQFNVVSTHGTDKDKVQYVCCQIDGSSQHFVMGTNGFDSRPLGDRPGYMKAAQQDLARWLVYFDRNEASADEVIGADYGDMTYGECFREGTYRQRVAGNNGPQTWAKKKFGGTAKSLIGEVRAGGGGNGGSSRQGKIAVQTERADKAEAALTDAMSQLDQLQKDMAELKAAGEKKAPAKPAAKPAKAKAKGQAKA